ncbi:MAG: hypothetical protein HOW73_39820 [Polyangiaceae bacterium]|nr:hypothetical protein [Polyangiaceae bacterium]
MRLRAIDLQGIRGLPSKAWDFPSGGSDGDIIAVTGPRGSGKTTFLEAVIAAKERVAPYGVGDARWAGLVPAGARSAKVTLTWELSAAEMDRLRVSEPQMDVESILGNVVGGIPRLPQAGRTLLGTWSDDALGRIMYFHEGRQLPSPVGIEPDRAARPFVLTSRNTKFLGLYPILSERSLSAKKERASTYLKSLCPELSFSGVTSSSGISEPLMLHSGGAEISYSMLSSSEQQAALVALTFASVPVQDSVILFDSPERDFGDAGALELLRAMLQWGTGNQFVVATSSRELLAALPRTRVVELAS